jgi:short-subunit dehydrogenase
MEKKDGRSWALVTGASGGMGADFARLLGDRGYNLVITARRADELGKLRDSILARHGELEVKVVSGDLSERSFRERLLSDCAVLDIEVLVNNAGFGAYGTFDATDEAKERSMLALDIDSLVHLTRALSVRMRERGRGFILETASIAAFQPCPLFATYAAAKAFVLSYGVAARTELAGTGVGVTVLCPGVTETAFFDVADQQQLSRFQRATMMKSEVVVRGALRALFAGKAVYVPGSANRVNAFLTRIVSRPFAARLAGKAMK